MNLDNLIQPSNSPSSFKERGIPDNKKLYNESLLNTSEHSFVR